MTWNDFNTAEKPQEFEPIPHGTLAKVRMTIKPGGYDDPSQGWAGGYATQKPETGTVSLKCEYVVLEGTYAKRKIFDQVGLHSPKNNNQWGEMGRSFLLGVLNSARGLSGKDDSPEAQNKRRVNGIAEFDGIEFIAKIAVQEGNDGNFYNKIAGSIDASHKNYQELVGTTGLASGGIQAQQATSPTASSNTPSWAQ